MTADGRPTTQDRVKWTEGGGRQTPLEDRVRARDSDSINRKSGYRGFNLLNVKINCDNNYRLSLN